MHESPSDSVDPFAYFTNQARLLNRMQPGKSTEWWRHRLVLLDGDDTCVYCGSPIAKGYKRPDKEKALLHIEHLIPRRHGGAHEPINMVASCARCNLNKSDKDFLTWEQEWEFEHAEMLLARRLKSALHAENHVLRDPFRGQTRKELIVKDLLKRWEQPRFTVFASLTESTGYILPGSALTPAASAALIAYGSLQDGQTRNIDPSRFIDLMWELIELNAWVRRIEIPGHPDPTLQRPGDSEWWKTFTTVNDVRRRRLKITPIRGKPTHERPMRHTMRYCIEADGCIRESRPIRWDWLHSWKERDLRFERNEDARERKAKAKRAKLERDLDAWLKADDAATQAAKPKTVLVHEPYTIEVHRKGVAEFRAELDEMKARGLIPQDMRPMDYVEWKMVRGLLGQSAVPQD